MAKNRDSHVVRLAKQALPSRAYAIIKWWHQQYDNTWLVCCPTQYPTKEWVIAFVFQQHCLLSPNGTNNAALDWGITEITLLTEEEYEATTVGSFDDLYNFAEVQSTTVEHIKEYGYNML